jgi:hypothetical protein
MAAFVMLAFGVANAAEQGVLKRLRGTPLPVWAHLAGRAGAAAWIAVLGTGLMLGVGVVAYGLEVDPLRLPALLLALLVVIVNLRGAGVRRGRGGTLQPDRAQRHHGRGGPAQLRVRGVRLRGRPAPLGRGDRACSSRSATPSKRWRCRWPWGDRCGTGVGPPRRAPGRPGAALGVLVATRFLGRERAIAAGRSGHTAGCMRVLRATAACAFRWAERPGMVWGQVRHANRSVWREPDLRVLRAGRSRPCSWCCCRS